MKTTRCHTLTKLLLSCLLLLLLLTVTVSAADTVTSGACGAEGDGSNLIWTLDDEGTLTISGSGRMMDYGNGEWGTIPAPWRENNRSIKAIYLEGNITSIGDQAFVGCYSLPSIIIPDSVTSIGENAFASCIALPDITIPDSVTSIGYSAFYNCRSLMSVTVPDSVTSIGDSVFEGCSGLTSVTIGSGVTSIGGSVFEGCTGLTSVTIPDSVTSIGYSAFSGCTGLTSVTIPDSVTSIGGSAFYGCSSLTSITIGSGVTSIGSWAFSGCSSLTNVYITDMDAWCRIEFKDSSATPMGYAKNIYLNGNKIASIDVPQGVTEIKDYAFYGFRDLIRVTISDSVTSIGTSAFSGCNSLISVTIPDSVTSIGTSAFFGCNSLISVTIPDSVTSIGYGAFSYCSSLTSVTIGSGVTSIGRQTFYGCSSLTNVYITDMNAWCRIEFEDSRATPMCYAQNIYLNGNKIASVDVPHGVTGIKGYTFYGFKDLIRVTIPDDVTSIGDQAFDGCSSLTSVTIPDSVTSIGGCAFEKCTGLTSAIIGSGVTSIGTGAFNIWSGKLTSVHITDVAAWCRINFDNEKANPLYCAKNLYVNGAKAETLEIPAGVQVISSNAFTGAECIKRVALPESLVGIGANAFSGCKNIERVYYAGSESEWNALPISAGNDSLKNAQIYYNSTLDDHYCRIRVKVSDGGRIYVDRSTAEEGDTVTVTAVPYAGYELDAIYVDGAEIEGTTFVVTGNHEVSAAFTKQPVYDGTQDYRLEGITVQTTAGEKLQELAREKLLVSVSVRHTQGTDGAVIMLAQYDAEGRYQGLVWLTLDEMPLNMALKVTLPVDNSDGKIVNLKAFVVGSILSPAPVGSAVSFGDV